ncbi:MAG: restriction endonuclease subunit S [Candidatus Pacearchaeota archaeon]
MMQKFKQLFESWKEVELGNKDYFEILSSGINKFEGEKDYLSTESIQGTDIEKTECKITYQDRPSRANMQPIFNSVWFAKMKETLKVYSFDKDNREEIRKYILSTGFTGIKVDEKKVYPKYLKLFLTSKFFNEEKDKLCTGSTQKGINNNFIVKIKIPLPSLQVQEQIVSILEKAELLKQKRKESDKLTKEYLQSVFYEMFGDPIKNNKKWDLKKLNELGKWLSGGTPSRSKPEYFEGDINWYSSGELNNLFISDSIEKITELAIKESGAKLIKKNSLLLGMYDTAALKSSITTNICSCNQAIAYSNLENKNVEILYLYYIIQIGKESYLKQRRGIRQQNLNLSMIKNIQIPLPPLELQKKFAYIVEQVEKLKEKQKQSREKIEEMFNSLMQRAFNGELVK